MRISIIALLFLIHLRYDYLVEQGVPEVVDGGVAEGQEDGVEGQALHVPIRILAQRARGQADHIKTIQILAVLLRLRCFNNDIASQLWTKFNPAPSKRNKIMCLLRLRLLKPRFI
jgi:hypothetical protein